MSFLDFKAKNMPGDAASGAISALIAIPDAIASAFLAGVNPTPEEAEEAVVILRLRGRDEVSSTFIEVIERYAQQLQAKGGKLILAGVHDHIKTQLDNTETTETIAEEDNFLETTTRCESTQTALKAAEQWLEANQACVLSQD